MAKEFTKEVDEALAACVLLDTLPKELDGFMLAPMRQEHEGQYDFFLYDAPAEHRAIVGFYDSATKTYKVRVVVGVVSFALSSFVCGDLETFGRELTRNLPRVTAELHADALASQELAPVCDAIRTWSHGAALAEELEGFSLFVQPSAPAQLTNGSFLIIDYVDFAKGNDVGIYYNCYRNEFFGEYHVAGMPYVSYDFDAEDLEGLEQRLELHLVRYLRLVAAQWAKEQGVDDGSGR